VYQKGRPLVRVREANPTIKRLPRGRCLIPEGNGPANELMPGVAIVAKSTRAAFSAKAALRVEG
jgi:hypothetical protein